jgi:tRNA pseudouridine32 synthase/23S rRNA pseudouridine746 synthase
MVTDPAGQTAETTWQWLASEGGTSLLRLTPTTGRTHQLRVHCASVLGYPIIGDPVYGRSDTRGMLLHASTLSVPRSGKDAVAAQAPFPARFAAFGYGADHG